MGRAVISGLRRWLKTPPMPVAVRCDGKTVIRIPNHSSRWAETENSVSALGCGVIEALDDDGTVIRVFRMPDVEDRPSLQKEEWPSNDTAQIAQAITAACDRAASRHENAYRMAFDRLSDMYNAQALRLEEAYRRVVRLETALIKAQAYVVDDENPEGTADALMTGLMSAVAAKVVGPVVPSNGAK